MTQGLVPPVRLGATAVGVFLTVWCHLFLHLCLQAQDARRDHLVEPRLWSRWYCHAGSGGEEADEREGPKSPWPWPRQLRSGSLEVEERVGGVAKREFESGKQNFIIIVRVYVLSERAIVSTNSWRRWAPLWTGTELASRWTLWVSESL